MKIIYLLALLAVLPCFLTAQSSLYVDDGVPVDVMIEDFFSSGCVVISNVSFSGDFTAKGYFEGANTDLGIPGGIFLSTGEVADASNNSAVFASGFSNGAPDSALAALSQITLYDGATISFDLVSQTSDTIYISYVFASEEYPEFVCSQFNDLFGFFVTGPAPDSGYYLNKNVAMVPELDGSGFTDYAVAINTINDGVGDAGGDPGLCSGTNGSLDFDDFYVANDGDNPNLNIVFDGMTVKLLAPLVLIPDSTYSITIAIADAADSAFDSGVFLGVESFCGDSLIQPVSSLTPIINGQTISFAGDSRYATAITIDFGNGFVLETTQPDTISYTYPVAGEYHLSISATNYCCEDVQDFNVAAGVPSFVVDNELTGLLTLAPNPVGEMLSVSWAGPQQVSAYTIYDGTGRQLLAGETNTSGATIELSGFRQGVYFLRVNVGDQVVTKTFFKR